MLGLVQLGLILSWLVFLSAPLVLLRCGLSYIFTRQRGRGALISALFVLGALGSGVLVWRLVPSDWTLPFWTTLKATVDVKTYGHPVEHYAEGIMTMITFAAVAGGIVCAALTAVGVKLLGKFRHA